MSINTANALSARLPVPPLPDLMLEPLVRSALLEDLGRAGDLTTDAIVPADAQAELRLVARQEGVLAGLDMARLAFRALDAQSRFEPVLRDGSELAPGQEIARIHGSAR
ncbi:MAG: nicotinate-nucleotide diphosphorylase (carboxylating), partial [Delftia sp.]|nr:nicotinate-nucleotide diphosphorylase (carboxylating) [Delftia sp.]